MCQKGDTLAFVVKRILFEIFDTYHLFMYRDIRYITVMLQKYANNITP